MARHDTQARRIKQSRVQKAGCNTFVSIADVAQAKASCIEPWHELPSFHHAPRTAQDRPVIGPPPSGQERQQGEDAGEARRLE
jgi:hypothetical protein